MAKRSYVSPVRDQRKESTRERIVDALVDVILVDGVHAFSVQNVADRAGVSHRTVYRHFPSREALLDGLLEQLSDRVAERVPRDALLGREVIAESFRAFDEVADALRAGVIASIALDLEPASRQRRSERLRAAFAEQFPHLDRADVDLTFTVLRELLVGSRSWFLLDRVGVDGHRGGAEVARIYDLVVDDLRRRDAAAAEE